jgi:CheY-like chemotaxis protein
LMDLQMPVMDGLTATREIRQKGNTTPIIAMTANVQSSDKVACEEAGMNYFLGKPVKKEDLEATVEEILKLSSSLA